LFAKRPRQGRSMVRSKFEHTLTTGEQPGHKPRPNLFQRPSGWNSSFSPGALRRAGFQHPFAEKPFRAHPVMEWLIADACRICHTTAAAVDRRIRALFYESMTDSEVRAEIWAVADPPQSPRKRWEAKPLCSRRSPAGGGRPNPVNPAADGGKIAHSPPAGGPGRAAFVS